MQCSVPLFDAVPLITVFVCVVLGQLLGRIKLGPIQLGGVCGALLVALLIGQTGCMVEGSLKDFAFALFIFAMGFSAGPQFVENLNLRGLRFGVLSIIEVVFVFGIVMIAVKFLGLDPGTAGGLAAGAATESAMVGTAIEALNRLGLDPEAFKALQANVVTAYTLTYVFGLITIVLFTNLLAPVCLASISSRTAHVWPARWKTRTVPMPVHLLPRISSAAAIGWRTRVSPLPRLKRRSKGVSP
ncbi:hypothetical protein [Pandoraea sp. PE-S2T-3]|uniref:aspartate-alanine antiporter-like transporter n=1 Tax=Pandoraea sp. PE-S2T-3 TaxID=1986993 RepID=UPI0034E8CD98